MLGKLFYHEFKNTAKIMLLLYALVGLLTAASILVSLFDDRFSTLSGPVRTLSSVIMGTMCAIYVLSLFALFVLTIVYLCIHFYKTMYSDQGYLTHTLPVSPVATLNVKMCTALVWVLGAVAVIFLSVFLLMLGASHGDILLELKEFFSHMTRSLDDTGLTPLTLLWYVFVTLVINCLSQILMVYACLSIGQLFSHKIAGAVVAGIVIYFVKRMITGIVTLTIMFDWVDTLFYSNSLRQFTTFFWAVNGLTAAFTAAFYATCVVIVQKYINLD
ncbi:MAG: hypothetical protein HFI35_03295 [Roseburia sp.]|jgi:hypothetical protein|nr:hypothetical protein [Roseburia sp.]